MNYFIANLPECLVKEILQFIIHDADRIQFRKYISNNIHDAYGSLYEIAFINNSYVENKQGIYLSRIYKKNGKSRYYLTKKQIICYCNGCGEEGCSSHYCRGTFEYHDNYTSKYVGKDINKALIELC